MDLRALLDDYEQNHQSLACKATHAVGIPLIALSLPMLLVNWKRALRWFLLGWTLQFAGHALEGKRPKFFEGSQYLLAGLMWWIEMVAAPLQRMFDSR